MLELKITAKRVVPYGLKLTILSVYVFKETVF